MGEVIDFAAARLRLAQIRAGAAEPPRWLVWLVALALWPLGCWWSLAELLKWGLGG